MRKETLENLSLRQRILFRTFWVNIALAFFVWLLSFIPQILFFGALMTGVPGAWFYYLMMCGLALWVLISVIFYLAPALAISWVKK